MPYEKEHKILSNQLEDMVLLESPFQETTRYGINLASVLLALTRKQFVIVMRRRLSLNPALYYNRIESQYALDDVELTVFKNTRRQVLKACFFNKTVKYFELGLCKKRKIFWDLWCNHVRELRSGYKKWPFQKLDEFYSYHEIDAYSTKLHSIVGLPDSMIVNSNRRKGRERWTDKYLYLGSNREDVDNHRPVPVPGLGNPEDIRLLHLKSEYFGCWDQSEHWVQCGDSACESDRIESPVSTYTGQPTTKVTYTSIITAVRIALSLSIFHA